MTKRRRHIIFLFGCIAAAILSRPLWRTWLHNVLRSEQYVQIVGSGQPVLLIHGLTGTSRYWSRVIAALKEDHKVMAPDLLGFGRSSWPDGNYSMDDQIAKLERLLTKEPMIVAGHSMGALIAIELAKRHSKRVRKLVLFAPPSFESRKDLKKVLSKQSKWQSIMSLDSFFAPLACYIHEVLGPLSYFLYGPFISPALPESVVYDISLHNWDSYNNSLKNIVLKYEAVDQLQGFKGDFSIFIGENDLYSKNAQLTERFPRKTILIKGGHNFLWEVSDTRFKKMIRKAFR